MRTALTLSLFVIALAFKAQTYSISPAKTVTFSAPANSITIHDIYMVNTGSSSLSLTWERVSVNVPAGWDYSICDLGTCHPGIPQGPTTMGTVSPGGSGFLGLNIDPAHYGGSGVVKVRVYVTGSPASADTLTWHINAVPTGLREQSSFGQLSVYPNPASGMLYFNAGHSGPCDVSLSNGTGAQVFNGSLQSNKGIDISQLEPGIYILRVRTESGNYTRRIIKE